MSSTIQRINNDLKEANTLKLLSTSFMEISAIKMKDSRDALQQNKDFYNDIRTLYEEIRINAQAEGLFSEIKIGSTLSIALTSNRRFYGTQNKDIFETFLNQITKSKTDAMLIGLTGKTYLSTSNIRKPIEVLVFKDDYPSTREIYELLDMIKTYEKVILYHPKFLNLMVQKPTATNITSKPPDIKDKNTARKTFIYEPELAQIIDFFETHVRFLLFRRSLLEVELARTSARLVAMIGAEQRAIELITKKKNDLSKAQKSLINARLIESISGAKRWSKI